MKCKIIDKKFIRKTNVVSYFITEKLPSMYFNDYKDMAIRKIISGLDNIPNLKTEDEFEFVLRFAGSDHYDYFVIENDNKYYITRHDNVKFIEDIDYVKEHYGIERIIKSGKKTILIDDEGNKYVTTKDDSDKDDIEKAVMMLLLKYNGYRVEDIYKLIESVEDTTPVKKVSTKKAVKVSTKKIKVTEENTTPKTV